MATLLSSQAPSQRSPKPPAPEDIPLYPTLQLGMTFETLEEAKNLITDAIAAANESFNVKNSKPQFWQLECRSREKHTCHFAIRVALVGKPKEWQSRQLKKHTSPS